MATSPENANGELGLWHFCPNTRAIDAARNASDAKALEPRCYFVSHTCVVELGYTVSTPFGPVFNFYAYDLFDPKPTRPGDPLVPLLESFPGPGSCAAYQTARATGMLAAFAAMTTWVTAPCSVLVPSRRKEGAGSGVTCAVLASLLGIAAVSAWAAGVHNPDTSAYGPAFACAVSACVLGVLSAPCLAAIGLLKQRSRNAEAARRQRQYMASEDALGPEQYHQPQQQQPYQPQQQHHQP